MSLEESIKLAVESLDAQLYDIVTTKENDRNIYRVLVTAKGGINLDKCAEISRMISPILDVEEPMSGVYNLEVSSPGIERKLRTKDHFKASIGDKVKIKDIATETYKGELLSADDNKILIKTEFGEEEVEYDSILSASTYFEW
ncbi:ribosome maturation factor RimP [Arcobacter roscoffensis]|uniref:Ribosome maturation factor RimP n=1 Tax=Arcobacter roscoffensis TaxID=2961520 RepID=A0ABY5E3Y4_9BACT|nr:ribosome maturation factor RimP [Arcobacter roscoffensis]UTJ06871.1 ribosome maturation factor RimP [Arcobacter roscoffensis]